MINEWSRVGDPYLWFALFSAFRLEQENAFYRGLRVPYESALEKLRSRSFAYVDDVYRLLALFWQLLLLLYDQLVLRALGRACSNLCKSSTSKFGIFIAKKMW